MSEVTAARERYVKVQEAFGQLKGQRAHAEERATAARAWLAEQGITEESVEERVRALTAEINETGEGLAGKLTELEDLVLPHMDETPPNES